MNTTVNMIIVMSIGRKARPRFTALLVVVGFILLSASDVAYPNAFVTAVPKPSPFLRLSLIMLLNLQRTQVLKIAFVFWSRYTAIS